MTTMVMMSPPKGNTAFALNVTDDIHVSKNHQRAIGDYLHEVSSSPISPSRNRSQGFPLCNSKTQMLRVNALYEENESEEQCLNRSQDYSQEYSRDYSCPERDKSREDAQFYLNLCRSSSREGNAQLSPLYQASSSSTASSSTSCIEPDENDSDFLTEARASLTALKEWQCQITIPSYNENGSDNSSCDASYNSSYDGNTDRDRSFDTQSERYRRSCAFDEIRENNRNRCINTTPQSCPDITPNTQSTKAWLQEIKEEESRQRNRIADAIAASSSKSKSTSKPTSKSKSKSNHSASLHHRATPPTSLLSRLDITRMMSRKSTPGKIFRNKENLENDYKKDARKRNQGKERLKTGRQKIMNIRHSWNSPSSFARRQRRNGRERDDEYGDDRNPAIHNAIDAAIETASPSRKQQDCSSPFQTTDKELILKRAHFGNARVVTMDGIVESFAADTAISHKHAPTSNAPLSWV